MEIVFYNHEPDIHIINHYAPHHNERGKNTRYALGSSPKRTTRHEISESIEDSLRKSELCSVAGRVHYGFVTFDEKAVLQRAVLEVRLI